MIEPCELLDVENHHVVSARRITDITEDEFRWIAKEWERSKAVFRHALEERGAEIPPNDTWNWVDKASTTSSQFHRFFGVATLRMQGMIMLSVLPQPCRSRNHEHERLLYVEYLESAPWNLPEYAGTRCLYRGVGSALLTAAIRFSIEAGCGGRLALHSLEGARAFYQKAGFINLGFDEAEGLDYFELTRVTIG